MQKPSACERRLALSPASGEQPGPLRHSEGAEMARNLLALTLYMGV